VADAPLLELGDGVGEGGVGGADLLRAGFPHRKRAGERAGEEAVDAAQQGGERPAGEPLVVLVEEAEGGEGGFAPEPLPPDEAALPPPQAASTSAATALSAPTTTLRLLLIEHSL